MHLLDPSLRYTATQTPERHRYLPLHPARAFTCIASSVTAALGRERGRAQGLRHHGHGPMAALAVSKIWYSQVAVEQRNTMKLLFFFFARTSPSPTATARRADDGDQGRSLGRHGQGARVWPPTHCPRAGRPVVDRSFNTT